MSKKQPTHYQLLGVDPKVEAREIKLAYRRLVKAQHPDLHHHKDNGDLDSVNEEMMRLNEAYATLMDATSRARYDVLIGLRRATAKTTGAIRSKAGEEGDPERYLRAVFHPCRQAMVRVMNMYTKQIRKLSADLYDDRLLDDFVAYVDKIEDTLRKCSRQLTAEPAPAGLHGAEQMMRYAIAQAADALEELRHFCGNLDYNHLSMAENLFKIASDLLRQAADMTHSR